MQKFSPILLSETAPFWNKVQKGQNITWHNFYYKVKYNII